MVFMIVELNYGLISSKRMCTFDNIKHKTTKQLNFHFKYKIYIFAILFI